nr:hypothetical protein [Butyrivibrio sp.]
GEVFLPHMENAGKGAERKARYFCPIRRKREKGQKERRGISAPYGERGKRGRRKGEVFLPHTENASKGAERKARDFCPIRRMRQKGQKERAAISALYGECVKRGRRKGWRFLPHTENASKGAEGRGGDFCPIWRMRQKGQKGQKEGSAISAPYRECVKRGRKKVRRFLPHTENAAKGASFIDPSTRCRCSFDEV